MDTQAYRLARQSQAGLSSMSPVTGQCNPVTLQNRATFPLPASACTVQLSKDMVSKCLTRLHACAGQAGALEAHALHRHAHHLGSLQRFSVYCFGKLERGECCTVRIELLLCRLLGLSNPLAPNKSCVSLDCVTTSAPFAKTIESRSSDSGLQCAS